ncbi:CWF19 family protein [Sporobolomyces koalae]|uniref:CWF19 family protein n=1 Tax=Sporobolomyces koalae TaxID=500713 RepID=UPI00316D896D
MGSSSHSRGHKDHDQDHDRHEDRSRSSSDRKHRHRDDDRDSSHRSHKKHRSSNDKNSSSGRHRSSSKRSKDKAASDSEDEWVEKESDLPAAKPPVDTVGTFTVGDVPDNSAGLNRLEPENLTDGYGEGDVGGSSNRGGGMFGIAPGKEGAEGEMDFFGGFGTEQKRKEPKEKPDPSQTMGQSSREINKAYWQGTAPAVAGSSTSAPRTGSPAPGSSGSAWRMTKLKRTYEAAEEEGRSIEEVAEERYGSLEAFEEAKEEKRILDERDAGRRGRRESGMGGGRPSTPRGMGADAGGRRFVFTDMETPDPSSRPSSRNAFRRPGEALPSNQPTLSRSASTQSLSGSRPSTPVPTVFTPPISRTPLVRSGLSQSTVVTSTVLNPDPTNTGPATSASGSDKPILSQSELNKLQAKVLKAKLMDDDSASTLEAEYQAELKRSQDAGPMVANHEGMAGGAVGKTTEVQVLPTLDGRGRMYDTGIGTGVADQWEKERLEKGKRGKKEKVFQSHDPKTGDVIRTSADDDQLSLADLVRQERFAGGSSRDMDRDVANRIATDARFNTDLDYQDENAERLARRKMKSESMKRQFAINDYARTKKALDSCTLCPPDDGSPPPAPTVALGTRAYLSLMETEELVPGHCRIVPLTHCLSCLEVDEEEGWEEIKNFMKTLMQMFAEEDKGVVFFETITTHKYQKHSYIEAIPIPFDIFDQLPIYFQEAISTSESEWSQHKKLITFSSGRPFRRALVPNLPYFMVQFDYKGENGFGHIIEGVDDAPERDLDGEERRGEVGEKGGGEFPRYFAQEIIGNLLDLPPKAWRKPKRVDRRDNARRIEGFKKKYDQFDWTKMLAQGGSA